MLLAAELPLLRTRGFTALPVIYIGKAATFALMSAFPLILLGHYDTTWSRVILACGWAFLIWGIYFYLWSFVLYAVQVVLVMRRRPRCGRAAKNQCRVGQKPMAEQALGGYDPYAGLSAHEAGRPQFIPVPSLLVPCFPSTWIPATRPPPPSERLRRAADRSGPCSDLGLASVGGVAGGDGVRRGCCPGPAGRAGGQRGPTGAGGQRALGGDDNKRLNRAPECAYGTT